MYLKDETKGWETTAKGTSPATTDTDADILPEGYGPDAGGAPPKFDPVTVSACMVNGKPLAGFTPTKSILVDANKKTLADTSDIDASGSLVLNSKS